MRPEARGRSRATGPPNGWWQQCHHLVSTRQKASRPWLEGPNPSLELGARSTWVTQRHSAAAQVVCEGRVGELPVGQEPTEVVPTMTTRGVRGRDRSGKAPPATRRGGSATPATDRTGAARQLARRPRRSSQEPLAREGPFERTGPRVASNRYRPKRVRLTAHCLFASLRARTRWVVSKSRPLIDGDASSPLRARSQNGTRDVR